MYTVHCTVNSFIKSYATFKNIMKLANIYTFDYILA